MTQPHDPCRAAFEEWARLNLSKADDLLKHAYKIWQAAWSARPAPENAVGLSRQDAEKVRSGFTQRPHGAYCICAGCDIATKRTAEALAILDRALTATEAKADDGMAMVPAELSGEMWSKARRVFANYAERYKRADTNEAAQMILDVAPKEIHRAFISAHEAATKGRGDE